MTSDVKPPASRTPCPRCQATTTTTGTLTERFVYLRCGACAEVWAIAERRAHRRYPQSGPPEPRQPSGN